MLAEIVDIDIQEILSKMEKIRNSQRYKQDMKDDPPEVTLSLTMC